MVVMSLHLETVSLCKKTAVCDIVATFPIMHAWPLRSKTLVAYEDAACCFGSGSKTPKHWENPFAI